MPSCFELSETNEWQPLRLTSASRIQRRKLFVRRRQGFLRSLGLSLTSERLNKHLCCLEPPGAKSGSIPLFFQLQAQAALSVTTNYYEEDSNILCGARYLVLGQLKVCTMSANCEIPWGAP